MMYRFCRQMSNHWKYWLVECFDFKFICILKLLVRSTGEEKIIALRLIIFSSQILFRLDRNSQCVSVPSCTCQRLTLFRLDSNSQCVSVLGFFFAKAKAFRLDRNSQCVSVWDIFSKERVMFRLDRNSQCVSVDTRQLTEIMLVSRICFWKILRRVWADSGFSSFYFHLFHEMFSYFHIAYR